VATFSKSTFSLALLTLSSSITNLSSSKQSKD
jgi:hypothetical protein